jgi:hypothetical protein
LEEYKAQKVIFEKYGWVLGMAAVKHVDDWTLLGNYREHPSSSSYTQKCSTKIMILPCGEFQELLSMIIIKPKKKWKYFLSPVWSYNTTNHNIQSNLSIFQCAKFC